MAHRRDVSYPPIRSVSPASKNLLLTKLTLCSEVSIQMRLLVAFSGVVGLFVAEPAGVLVTFDGLAF